MSGVFDLATEGRRALDEDAALNPLRLEDMTPSMWKGSAEALKGLLRPSAGAGRTLLMAGAPVAQAIDKAKEAARGVSDAMDMAKAAAAGLPVVAPERTPITAAQDWYFRNVVDELGSTAVDYWTADPDAMGGAAKAVNVGGTVVGSLPQLFGMPGVFLAQSGVDPATELIRQDVDLDTAAVVGGVNLAANAIGLRLPAAWGNSLTQRLATGAGSNLAIGGAADVSSSAVLEEAGYTLQAKAYEPGDVYARGLDVLMGVAFGYKAHIDAPRLLSPAQRDAVLSARNNDHARRLTMPGEPRTPGAAVAHANALSEAIAQVIRGEPVNIAGTLNPDDFILRGELRPPPSVEGLTLRGGSDPEAVQADYEALGKRHGFRTTSTTRSAAENERVGGVEHSQHLEGRGTARDWSVRGKTPEQIEAFVADLRAAGFEVITRPHGTGPHIHAELPPGGRRAVEPPPPREVAAATEPDADAARPTVEALRSGVDLPAAPPREATFDEFAAWTEGRLRAELPARAEQLRQDLPRFERDAAEAAEQAALRPQDGTAQRYAQEQQAALDDLRSRIEDAEAGRVALPEPELLRSAYEGWRSQEAGRTDRAPDQEQGPRQGDTPAPPRQRAVAEFGDGALDHRPDAPVAPGSGAATATRIASAAPAAAGGAQDAPSGARTPTAARGASGQGEGTRGAEAAPAAATLEEALKVVAERPGMQVVDGFDADGNPRYRTAAEVLADIEAERARAANDAQAFPAAVSCFLRMGS